MKQINVTDSIQTSGSNSCGEDDGHSSNQILQEAPVDEAISGIQRIPGGDYGAELVGATQFADPGVRSVDIMPPDISPRGTDGAFMSSIPVSDFGQMLASKEVGGLPMEVQLPQHLNLNDHMGLIPVEKQLSNLNVALENVQAGSRSDSLFIVESTGFIEEVGHIAASEVGGGGLELNDLTTLAAPSGANLSHNLQEKSSDVNGLGLQASKSLSSGAASLDVDLSLAPHGAPMVSNFEEEAAVNLEEVDPSNVIVGGMGSLLIDEDDLTLKLKQKPRKSKCREQLGLLSVSGKKARKIVSGAQFEEPLSSSSSISSYSIRNRNKIILKDLEKTFQDQADHALSVGKSLGVSFEGQESEIWDAFVQAE